MIDGVNIVELDVKFFFGSKEADEHTDDYGAASPRYNRRSAELRAVSLCFVLTPLYSPRFKALESYCHIENSSRMRYHRIPLKCPTKNEPQNRKLGAKIY